MTTQASENPQSFKLLNIMGILLIFSVNICFIYLPHRWNSRFLYQKREYYERGCLFHTILFSHLSMLAYLVFFCLFGFYNTIIKLYSPNTPCFIMFYNLFKAHYIYYNVLIPSEDLLTLLTEYQKKMHFEHWTLAHVHSWA